MPINFSNVNISLRQFQEIASGKYNAGEVRLTSDHTLDKLNHHIHFTGFNTKNISHEEVLAVKNAFVKALSTSGVGEDEIARVRRDLGLATETGAERSLHERSIKPLTRQQVRDILDRYAETINAHAADAPGGVRIHTSSELYGEGGMRANRAERRDAVNAVLDSVNLTTEHEGVALAEAVVAGDVDFRSYNESQKLLAQIRAQLGQILETSHGSPSAEREAVIQFRIRATGQRIRIPTGMSELAFVRKLEGMAIRLETMDDVDDRGRQVRREFGALASSAARLDWLDALQGAPDAGFKARTAAVLMFTQAGIDDWETLSLINHVPDEQVLAFAKDLASLDGQFRGAQLRQHALVRSLADLANGQPEVPEDSRATIPATSPRQWNLAIRSAIVNRKPERLPHDVRALLETIPGHLTDLFGPDIIAFYETGVSFIGSNHAHTIIPDNTLDGPPLTAESLRDRVMSFVEKTAAENFAKTLIERALVAAGGGEKRQSGIWNDWGTTRPQLRERLLASRSAAETKAIFAEFRNEIEGDARRFVTVMRENEKATAFYRDALAQRLGIPSACLDQGLEMDRFQRRTGELGDKIRRGQIAADTDEQIAALFRDFATNAANARAAAVETVETMELPPALRDKLKDHLISVDRPEKIDLAATIAAARTQLGPLVPAIDAALVPGAPKTAVYAAMKPLSEKFRDVIRSLFPPDSEVGAEEMFTHGTVIIHTIVHDCPGLADRLVAFFARPDVQGDNFVAKESPAQPAGVFQLALPNAGANVALASSLGTSDMPPFQAQALMRAFEDASLGALSVAERMAVLRPGHPAGSAIAAAIAEAPTTVTPSRLREITVPILRNLAGAAPVAIPEADAARFNAVLDKYSGGLSEADQTRLREFAQTLDFSEAHAAASEKALAVRLDQICGTGSFDNPASSASRRALAAGFTLADLPMLARVASALEASGPTEEEAVEAVLDQQSDFRRNWDAALLCLVNNEPVNLAQLTPEERIAVARAVICCEDNAELTAVVTNGIGRVIRNGAGDLRSPRGIERVVENVRYNIAVLRDFAGNDEALFAAGMKLLKGMEARRIPAGFLQYLVESAKNLPLDGLAGLKARSKAADIHLTIAPLALAIDRILRGGDSKGFLEGADEVTACRIFLMDLAVLRLAPAQRRNARAALENTNAPALNTLYQNINDDKIELPQGTSYGVYNTTLRLAGKFQKTMETLFISLGHNLGVENPDAQIPFQQGELDVNGIRAADIGGDIMHRARPVIAEIREQFLDERVGGRSSDGARAMREIYGQAVGPEPFEPGVEVNKRYTDSISNLLAYGAVRGAKGLVASDNLAGTKFAEARQTGLRVELPGGHLLSDNPATARDELSRFVTGRPDAAWATLSAGERNQVAVLMSLLTHEAALASIQGPAIGLDARKKTQAFSFTGTEGAQPVFKLDLTSGVISVNCELELHPTALVVGGEAHSLTAGDTVRGGFYCSITPEELNRINDMDLAHADTAAAEEFYNRTPPEENRLNGTVSRIPAGVRLNLLVNPTFDTHFA